MVSGLAGIAVFLGVAVSTGAFVRGALKKNKRPTIGSILVALFVVPLAAASVSGLVTGPLELLGRVPGLSIVAWLVATAVLVVTCAIGGHFLAFVMGEPKGAKAGDVMRGAQLSTADRWQKRTQRMQARDAGVVSLAGLAIDRADEPKHFLFMGRLAPVSRLPSARCCAAPRGAAIERSSPIRTAASSRAFMILPAAT